MTDSDPAALEGLIFGIATAYNSPVTGTVTPVVKLGPIGGGTADNTSSIPRFGSAVNLSTNVCTDSCLNAPESITFNYTVGGVLPAPIQLFPVSTGTPIAYSFGAYGSGLFTISPPNTNWLTVSDPANPGANQTITPNSLSVAVNPAGFSPGQYPGFITLAKIQGSSPYGLSRRVFVLLNVFPASSTSSGTLDCTGVGGVPPIVRFPGQTELQGDVVVQCTSPSTGAVNVITNVRVTLNAAVTTRVTSGISDALLLINEPNPPYPVTAPQAVYRGEQTSSNTLLFRNVMIPAAASPTVILRITNILADTSSLGTLGGILSAFVSTSGISLAGPTATAGFISTGLNYALRDASNTAVSTMTFPASSAPGPSGAGVTHLLSFQEGFASAFKRRNVATSAANPLALANQSSVGAIYNTETGFYFSGFPAVSGFNTAGLATQGTRLLARFNNVPAGVSLYVTTQKVTGSSPGVTARLVQTDTAGAGSYNEVTSSITGSFGVSTVTLAPVQLVNGSGIAVWEIVGSDPLSQEEIRFGVVPVYNSAQSGAASVSGVLAPLAGNSQSSLPRFVDNPQPLITCQFLVCLTLTSAVINASSGSAIGSSTITVSDYGQPTPFVVESLSQPWMRISAFGGTTPATLTVTGDATGLAVGTYIGVVTIRTDFFTYTSNITFNVSAPPPPVLIPPSIPALQLTPERIPLQVVRGDASVAPLQLRLAGDNSQSFTATPSAPWLKVSPASGSVPATLSVTIDSTNLAPGEYLGTITATSPGANSVTTEIRLTVIDPPQLLPQQTSFTFKTSDGAAPQVLYLTAKGKQLAYTASVTTESGNWLSVTPNAGMTPVNLQVTVNPNTLAPGTYKGAVVLGTTDISTSPISLPVTLEVGSPRPVVTAVLNGASFASGGVAPGMLVSIMGSNLLGQQDGSARVLFDGIAARIVSMQASQLNVMVPYGVAGSTTTSVVIEVPGSAASAPIAIRVVLAAPAIFTANASGSGGAAALNTDQTLNTPSNAASRGSIVTLYATGAGQLTPQGVDGEVLSGSGAIPTQPVGVLVDGSPMSIEYHGNAPGLISGILQVNFRIPLNASIGPAVPLVLTVGEGRSTAGVTIAIK